MQADLSVPDSAAAAVEQVAATLGRLDILINMASVYVQRPFDDASASGLGRRRERRSARGVSVRPRGRAAHAREGGGRIINFSDWVAASGRPRYKGYLPYYVAKAGVIALTEALALELALRQHSRQRDCARADRRAAGHDARRNRAPSRRRRRSDDGAARARSRKRCWR